MASPEKFKSPSSVTGTKQPVRPGFKDRDMQVIIGWILRVGVAASTFFVVIGGIIFLYRHGQSRPDFHTFNKVPGFISSVKGVIRGVINLKGQAIIQLGIVLLIATPIMRVIFAGIGFLVEKDYLYTFISLVVLLIIFASMVSGHIG
jgi:uncharacterized membrane protein